MYHEIVVSDDDMREIAFGGKHFLTCADKNVEPGDTLVLKGGLIGHVTVKAKHVENITQHKRWVGFLQVVGW